jgi:hypothetical protein
MIYTPTFLKIKKLLTPSILEYVKKYGGASTLGIHRHIANLKRDDPETYELIDFDYSYAPYSNQVAIVLTDLVRDCHLQETDEGYKCR